MGGHGPLLVFFFSFLFWCYPLQIMKTIALKESVQNVLTVVQVHGTRNETRGTSVSSGFLYMLFCGTHLLPEFDWSRFRKEWER